jgi:4-hydroxy-tetrahydrodipicolinate synthase
VKNLKKYPLWTALITPLQTSQKVDFTSLASLLREQNQVGNGILILGSTGEALNLQLDEKKHILNFVCEQNLQVPIMVGVGGHNLEETKNWIKYLETLPLDSYLMVTPIYSKPGPLGQFYWFKELLDESSRPSILYNVPSRAGTSLNHQSFSKLKDHPQLFGLKEASGSQEEFKKFRKIAPHLKIYSGDDPLWPSFARLGADASRRNICYANREKLAHRPLNPPSPT